MKVLNITMVIVSLALISLVGFYSGKSASALNAPAIARFNAVDIKSKTRNDLGNISTFAQIILDPKDRLIGNAFTSCIVVLKDNDEVNLCHGVYNLPKGKLTIEGSRRSRERYTFVITGGSGFYSGVGGRLNGLITGSNPYRERLIFHIE